MYPPTAHTLTHTCTHSHPHTTHTYCTYVQTGSQAIFSRSAWQYLLHAWWWWWHLHDPSLLYCSHWSPATQPPPARPHPQRGGAIRTHALGGGVLTLSLSSLSAAPPGAILSTQRGPCIQPLLWCWSQNQCHLCGSLCAVCPRLH